MLVKAPLDTAPPTLSPAELRARIFDEMNDAVLVADDDRRYVDANAAACALLGCSREQILSLKVEDVMPATGNIDELWSA
jgi:PAS domain S-box-containing protein